MGEYFDISPMLSEQTAVFPGDTPLRRNLLLSWVKGDHLELSSFCSTLHLGAHADAPSHYSKTGVGIGERDLSYYFGEAQVVSLRAPLGQRVGLSEWGSRAVKAPRVLIETGSYSDSENWNPNFNSLHPDLIQYLADQGVRLVGIDTPSIDPAEAKDLLSHDTIARNDLAILEGLVLSHVPEGKYQLIALPLRLNGFDASPVRAILLPLKNS